jgi:hypothetical protein
MKVSLFRPHSWDVPPALPGQSRWPPPGIRTDSVLDATPVPDCSQPQIFGREARWARDRITLRNDLRPELSAQAAAVMHGSRERTLYGRGRA